MSSLQRMIAGATVMAALQAFPAAAGAQGRFEVMTHDTVSAVPALHVITLRDSAKQVCYTLFLVQPSVSSSAPGPADPRALDAARDRRDRRLDELTAAYENTVRTSLPGVEISNPLQFAWEAQKAQSDYEQAILATELARIERWLEQVAAAPMLAVSSPAPCAAPASVPPSDQE